MRIVTKPAALFLLLAGLFALATPARAQLGVAAGLNFDDLQDIQTDSNQEATFDNATGWHIGVFYDLAVGPVAVRPGVYYRDAGSIDYDLNGARESFDLSMVEVAADARFRLAALPIVRPYVLAAPVVTFANTGDEAFEDNLKDLQLSADVGLGVELSLPGFDFTLYPELRYSFGVTRFLDEDLTFGDATVTADDSARLNTFMVRLGIGF